MANSSNLQFFGTNIRVQPLQYRVEGGEQALDPNTGMAYVRTGVTMTVGAIVVHMTEDAAKQLRYAMFDVANKFETQAIAPTHGLPDPESETFAGLCISIA